MSMEDQEQVARFANMRLGNPVQEPAEPVAPPVEQPETQEEMAQTDAAPKTEADRSDEDPMAFIEIKMGNDVRKLTDKQIASTYDRYSKLNHKHSEVLPLMRIVDKLVETSGATPGQAAQYMANLLAQAGKKNVAMGGDGQVSQRPGQDTPQPNIDAPQGDPFADWESENDVALPPGYREQAQNMANMNNKMGQIEQLLMNVLNQARGTTEQAVQQQNDAAMMREQAMRDNIRVNIDNAADRHGIGEEDSENFMMYMAERGFTLEDFIDPGLADTVMKDFANDRNGPELEQLRKIHERRIAYQGTMPGTPSGSSAGAPKDEGDPMLDRMINKAMNRRVGVA